jgi:hypothetical protein
LDRIDTYGEFKRAVVEPDFREFMADRGNLRKAWHCAGSLFHLHNWVYAAHKKSIDANYTFVDDQGRAQSVSCAAHFANSLGQKYPNFQLVRGIANSSKHVVLHPAPSGRVNPPGMPSAAANTYVSGRIFQPGVFDPKVFQTDDVKLQSSTGDIEFAVLAQAVLTMWDELFANGW